MLYICSHKTCPEYVEPCIFSMDDMNHALGRTTVCPVGEDEDAMEIDELMTFFCLIVGSRAYDDYETFSKIVDKALSSKQDQEIVIVSGGAKGADQMAERYAKEHNHHLIVMEADWDNLGKKAGPVRNEQMHRFISHFPLSGMGKAVGQPPILSLPKNMATRSVYTITSKTGLPYIVENIRKRGIVSLFFCSTGGGIRTRKLLATCF